jgi:hypothetical protein
MKDPVLNRPLFRKKAGHVQQIKKNDIPGYVLGGVIAVGGRVIPAARAGMQAFRTAQAGRKAAGTPTIGGQLLSGAKRVSQKPGVAKGLTALEVGTAGAGVEETRRAAMGEQSLFNPEAPATYTGGLSALYGGTGLVGRTAKFAFPGSKRVAGAAQAITRKTPFAAPIAIGGAFAAPVEAEAVKAVREEKEFRIPEEKLNTLETQFKELGKDGKVQDYINIVKSAELTDKQKQGVYKVLGIEDFVTQQEGKDTEQVTPPKQEAGQPKTQMPDETTVQNQMIGQVEPVLDTSKMSSDEQDDLAVTYAKQYDKADKQAAQAESMIDEDFRQDFLKMKNSIQQTTGNTSNTNLIMLKLASGLLTGKSREKGIAGLADIAGQAMGPAVDTAIVLNQAQQEFDNNLALQLIKSRQKAKEAATVKASQNRQFVVETNEGDDLFPEAGRYIPVNKDTGQYLDSQMTDQGEVLTQYTGNGRPEKPDEKTKSVAFKQLNDLARGIEFAQIVAAAPLATIGPEGRIRELTDKFQGAGESFLSSLGPIDDFKVQSFNDISEQIMQINPGNATLSEDVLASRTKEAEKLLGKFQKEDQKVTEQLNDALESNDQERVARAQLRLIEQRMKYIIANANKGQDRLTVADIRDAEARTKIFDILDNPKQILKNYEAIERDLNGQFKKNAGAYVRNGGSRDYVLSKYRHLSPVQNYLRKQDQKKTQTQDYTSVLEGI